MTQFQTTTTILDLRFAPASEDSQAFVSIQKPLGKGLFEEVGQWNPYAGLRSPRYVPHVDFERLSQECARVYVAGLNGSL